VTESEPKPKRRALPLVVAGGVFALAAVVLAGVAFWTRGERRRQNEVTAIGCLKAIATAETIFREEDRDKNGALDYGDLAQLTKTGLIDTCLGSGTYNGYLFEAAPSASTSEFLWFAVANPIEPGVTGDRAFCINYSGVIYYTTSSFALNTTDCAIAYPRGISASH
jgi:hypothetical protein